MERKIKELKDYTNGEILAEVARRFQSKSFPEPISAPCFKCQKQFLIKFVASYRDYAKRNSWNYWSEKKEDKEKKICNPCLKSIYLNEKEFYLANIKNVKKKRMLSAYISDGSI